MFVIVLFAALMLIPVATPVEEMSQLIKANRHFESIQKAIKTYDTISGKAVNEISRF